MWLLSLTEIADAGGSAQLVWIWLLPLPLLVYAASRAGLRYGRRRIVVYRAPTGLTHFRGPIELALLWFVLYVARFLLEDLLLGGFSVFFQPFYGRPPSGPPAGVSLELFAIVVIAVAGLYLVSFGALLGISLAVWGHHRHLSRSTASDGVQSAPSSEPPPASLGNAETARPLSLSPVFDARREGDTHGKSGGPAGARVPPDLGDPLQPIQPQLPGGSQETEPLANPSRSARAGPLPMGRFCRNCGHRLGPTGRFCSACGASR